MTSSSPPEDPEYTSEPKLLSPVSPKPIHFPIPDNIPVLQKQTDTAFNQMDAHMGDFQSQQGPAGQTGNSMDTQTQETAGREQMGSEQTGSATFAASNTSPGAFSNSQAMSSTSIPDPASAGPAVPVPALQDPNAPPTLQTGVVPQSTASEVNGHDGQQPPPNAASGMDYLALLNSLQTAPPVASAQEPAPSYIPLEEPSTASQEPAPPGTSDITQAGLPPRPPPQAQPAINSNFASATDIRSFHPHVPNNAPNSQGSVYQAGPNGLPPPPVPSFQQAPSNSATSQVSPTVSGFNGQLGSPADVRAGSVSDIVFDGEPKMDAETQKEYDNFLEQERHYVTEGNWEQFPNGSRLFVGNLSSERVTKRDVFHVFHSHGKLAQISIKQAYGFVQFLSSQDCQRALQAEQGKIIRGKRINLEISKPQKNRPGAGGNAGRRRSRSPDRAGAGTDRYTGGGRQGATRARDDYRPGRSPSPRSRRDRSRERYGRYRSRSRSRGRYRDPSPRRDEDDELPLPRRSPRDVPDVQVIVVDNLDRQFIQWVERAIAARGVKVDVLILSPRLPEAAVIKRQILEGVLAVSRMNRFCQQTGKIPLQVFDRRGGSDVRFEEYADLDPDVAAQVVLRAKASAAPVPASQAAYGYGYGAPAPPAAQQPFATAGLQPNIGNAISSMDPASLQKLLGAMQQPGQAPQVPSDLATMLGGAAPPSQAAGQYGQAHRDSDPLAALRANPALAGLLGGQAPPQQAQAQAQTPQAQHQGGGGGGGGGGGQPNMADILAKLGNYKR